MTSRAPARDPIAPGDQAAASAVPREAAGGLRRTRGLHALIDRYPFNSPWVHATARTLAQRWLLPLWFLALTVELIWFYATEAPNALGFDVRLYRLAADEWLAGGNPWLPSLMFDPGHDVVSFAGPPPTLIPFIALSWIPIDVLILLFMLSSAAVALWTLRRLGLPVWWMLFPPIVQGIWVGNLNIFVIALLVAGGTFASALAGALKVYAVVPLIVLGRWKAVALTALLFVVTGPLLPWPEFLANYDRIGDALTSQAWGGQANILVGPVALVGGCLALILLGREKAAWLAVPVLWPATQLHYTVTALPVLTPWLAAFAAVHIPGAFGLGVMTYAIWIRRDWFSVHSWSRRPRPHRIVVRDWLNQGEPGRASGS